jgi:phospholipid/cholesterol/gamma-HCH transport system substrate-binding protein
VRRARRIVPVAACGLAIGLAGAFATGTGRGGDGYLVRAVFDNASFVIAGEDVKIAGVKVGSIAGVELTHTNKAAVVLRIDDPAFRPFRADAHCDIRLQSLIGEQYVECDPTTPRAAGVPEPPELAALPDGPARGQHYLPVTQTTTPVGVDLLNDIMRLPEQERFRLIIGELGAGLAGNGDELRAALRRASPALQQTDRVVAVLARQDKLLGDLVDASDRDLAPLAAQRRHLGGFISHAGAVGAATAARGDALEASFAKLPAFLRQLGPAADRFGALADQMTPALQSLDAQAPAINASVKELGSISTPATDALVSFGKVADQGRRTFPRINTLSVRLDDLAAPLRTVAKNLADVGATFDNAGGIESLMRFIYFYTGSVNGEDRFGHYIRTLANINNCVRVSTVAGGCESTFDKTQESYGGKGKAYKGDTTDSYQAMLDYLLGNGTSK